MQVVKLDQNGKILYLMEVPVDENNNPIYPEYYTETLPISDVPEGFLTWNFTSTGWDVDIEGFKYERKIYIGNMFKQELIFGIFTSTTLGTQVDCRRGDNNNDKQNVEGLISYMTRNSITTVNYVAFNSIVENVTIPQLESLVAEMEDHVLGLYQKKWQLESQIISATTVSELTAICW